MIDLQTKHGFSGDDPQGLFRTAAFIAHGLGASITTALSGHTPHTLTAGWFAPDTAGHASEAIKLLREASQHLDAAVPGEEP